MSLFAAGAKHKRQPTCPPDCNGSPHRERLFLAANRVGKTEGAGGVETTYHVTGLYPDWWPGAKFDHPIRAWVAGDTSNTVRDILQNKLLGPIGDFGTGLIPKRCIDHVTWKRNVPDAVQDIYIKHVTGKNSIVTFKCFAAGTRIKMADGSLCDVERVRIGDFVLCADGGVYPVTETHAYAAAQHIRIVTRSGEIVVTPNHRMFTQRGEVPAADLVVGDALQIAFPETPNIAQKPDWLVKLTALMIGDGCMRAKTPFFTCNEPSIVEAVCECLPAEMYVVPVNNTISYKIASTLHKDNPLKSSLENDGLWGLKSTEKFIPPWVFRLPKEQKRTFLHWLFGCDGTINDKTAAYGTSSIRLAEDVRLLLWDFGIHAPIKRHMVGCNGKKFVTYDIPLYGENRIRFSAIGKLNRDVSCNITPRPKGPPGEIIAIEAVPDAPAYCVTVAESHEVIANGYRSGNSYDQKRESFQGTEQHLIWLDEEPEIGIYAECLLRTMTTNGLVLCTFTPLLGLSDVVLSFLPGGQLPSL